MWLVVSFPSRPKSLWDVLGRSFVNHQFFGQVFRTNIQIAKGFPTVSLVNCIVEKVNGQIWVNEHDQTTVLYRPQQSVDGLKTLVETCAGIGAVGCGFSEYDMHTAAYCDNNPKFCSWLRNHTDKQVIEGNIADMNTIAALSKAVPQPHVINGGVSCQPFSKLGDKGEGSDNRSQSFTGLLKAAYHMQSLVIVMECTPGVKESSWGQNILKEFVNQTGYHMTQTVLEMHHLWPSVRNRWWAVLTHPAIGPVDLPQMPSIGWDPSVFHLMPRMMKLDENSLTQLELDLYELRHFHQQTGGIAKSAFDPFRPMPTATHSWGSQVKGCHCGCRASGFSEERVANKGLYGVLIPLDRMVESAMGPYHAMRHPHPMEIALVNGLEPSFVNNTNGETLKLALAGVGQLASPLQSAWIWGNVLQGIVQHGFAIKKVDPTRVVAEMCQALFRARDELLQIEHKTKYMEIFETAIQKLKTGSPHPKITDKEEIAITQLIHERCIQLEVEGITPVDRVEEKTTKGKGGCIPKKPSLAQSVVVTPKEFEETKQQGTTQVGTSSTGGVLGFETTMKRKKTEDTPACSSEKFHKTESGAVEAPVVVSATVLWTHPVVTSSEAPIVNQDAEESNSHRKLSYNITNAGEIPFKVEYEGDVTIAQALEAEIKMGNVEPNATVRTSVGTFVAKEHFVHEDYTYIVFPTADVLNDVKCPKNNVAQTIPDIRGHTRIQGLFQQKGWVAIDEMTFYLEQIAQQSFVTIAPPIVLPSDPTKGMELGRWILQAMEIAAVSNKPYRTMSVCLTDSHWIPIKIEVMEEKTIITTFADDSSCIRDLLHPLAPKVEIREQPNRHVFPADCGFQAAAWILEKSNETEETSDAYPITASNAGIWRNQFAKHLVENRLDKQIVHQILMGGMPETNTKSQLHALLTQHGVKQERVQQCADYLVDQLGMQTIKQVVGSHNAWKDLKIRASQNRPPIQIVLAEELKHVIEERIATGQSFGRKQNKENHKPKASVNSWKGIKANQVNIPQTVFKQSDGELLPQITVHQFHQKSKGIAVVNINEALPFCQLENPISTEGVGLIIVDYQDPRVPSNAETIQFPAICADTGDSMLVLGAIIQLGQKCVSRNSPANCSAIEEIPTNVVRTMVYKDQYNQKTWEELNKGPVKAIMELPEFQEIPEGSIIDVWDRQHVTKSFQRTKPNDCDIFIVSIRSTKEGAERILEASGRNGVYHEPRTDSGRSPNEGFKVIWLPKKGYGEVVVAKQTSPVQTWLVRNGDRYGLRTSNANHQALHRHHKPEVEFLAGETSSFRVVVQANQVPPFWVYTMSHGDILITQAEGGNKGNKSNAASAVPLASQRTVKHLTTSVGKHALDKTTEGPFQLNDPWAPTGTMISSSQIASIESLVEKRVMAHVQPAIQQALSSNDDAEMIPAVDDRVFQLEAQVKQMNECMLKSTQSFQAFQQQQLQQNQAMTHQISAVKQQVDSQNQSMQTMLDAKMEDQMSRIEALLVKRMKVNEWPLVAVEAFCRTNRQMWSILLLSITMRIGEAKNPGPPGDPGLTIGAINACGLMNKGDTLLDLPYHGQSIWGVSETHLTATGIVKFSQDLKIKKSNLKLHHGPPAPYRSTTQHSIGGKHVGAGFLSTVPCETLTTVMPPEIMQEARVDTKAFFCQGKWIYGATCYGFAHRAETQEVRNHTDQLLQYITDTIVFGAKGYRFVTGDFNQPHGVLEQTKIWEQNGWKEIQVHMNETQLRPIQATCKNATTRDFVWLSPELLQHLESIEVVDHVFPDHSILCAHFRSFFKPEHVYLWRKPKSIDWTKMNKLQEGNFDLDHNASTSEQMLSIAQEFEQRIAKKCKEQNKGGSHPTQMGRSATTSTTKIVEYNRPITKARQGDFQPGHTGVSLQYARWVKQMRRLESLCRNLSKDTGSDKSKQHANREWQKIMTASGFPGGFQSWWKQLGGKHGSSPNEITWLCPSFSQVQGIVFTFMKEVHQFEEVLNRERKQRAKDNRSTNPNKIFDDIAKPRALPIQLLEEPVTATIVSINPNKSSVTVDKAEAFDPGQDIEIGDRIFRITKQHSQTEIEFEDTSKMDVGNQMTQRRKYGAVEDIFAQFAKEWKARWDRHANTPESEWDPICEFFRLSHPDIPSQKYTPITIDQWKQSLRRKKKRAATGPDGWSRDDLLHLPDDLTKSILQLITQIELGKQWPTQLITGIVHSLEKTQGASRVSQFRPITIFSLIYRNWASIRAREALKYMMQYTPSGCFGNVPGRSATQLWLSLQVLIEDSHHNGDFVTGGVIDIVKCFNPLPRVPLVSACITLGMPGEIARAWQQGLSSIERRFDVRGSTGPPLRSTTGFPEGCPLSVVAMLSANCIIHDWLSRKAPMCRLWTFVDNIEITASNFVDAQNGMQQLSTIVRALDLDVDENKTYMWSTDPAGRKQLRQENIQQKTWARDLGGQVQYSRQATNCVITQKMVNALHGSSSVSIGDENYEPLRTGATRALGQHHNGVSPIIHLSMVEHPSHDPAYYTLWQTVSDVRNHVPKTVALFLLTKLAQASDRIKPEVGPCSVLLHRMHQILWYWNENMFVDHKGLTIDIWEVCIQELAIRLAEAWQARTAREKSWRKTFAGLDESFPKISRLSKKLTPQQASVVRNNQNGTFYTADHLKHRAQGQSTNCLFCGKEDSVYHRLWECEELTEARNQCPKEVRKELLTFQQCTYNHGWFPEPPSLLEFRTKLHQLTLDEGQWCEPLEVPETLEIFTDGTCANPKCEITRIGAWGVAIYQPNSSENFVAVASGLLAGIHQTIARAELQAAIVGCHFAQRYQKPYRLWIDNAYVIKVVKIVQNNCEFYWSPGSPNHDLLNNLTNILRQTQHLFQGVNKVYSHQRLEGSSPEELWAFEGNAAADSIAANVLIQEQDVLQTWQKLKEEVEKFEFLKQHQKKAFARVQHTKSWVKRVKLMGIFKFAVSKWSNGFSHRCSPSNSPSMWQRTGTISRIGSIHFTLRQGFRGDGRGFSCIWTIKNDTHTEAHGITKIPKNGEYLKRDRKYHFWNKFDGSMRISRKLDNTSWGECRSPYKFLIHATSAFERKRCRLVWRMVDITKLRTYWVSGRRVFLLQRSWWMWWKVDHKSQLLGPRSCLLGRRFEDIRKSRKSV